MTSAVMEQNRTSRLLSQRLMRYGMFRLILILTLLASPLRAEVHALLVGVGDYQHLDADLAGPENDVALLAQVLTERGVAPDRITVLATGLPELPDGASFGAPERDAILEELDRLAEVTGEGDTVFFYFSGHGSQAPDADGDDQGGYDEILLPSDAKGWRGAVGDVENAILDDELRLRAEAILSDGASLIGVLDACHTATGFRAMGSGAGKARYIAPAVLGLPEELPEGREIRPAPTLKGDFAFLYSSQSNQRSFEFPVGEAEVWHGAFSLALANALRRYPNLSWGQALEVVRETLQTGPAAQTPDGEGSLLDAAVFGGEAGAVRTAIRDGKLQAGALSGLTLGSKVALYASPAGGAALGEATIEALNATTSTLDTLPSGARFGQLSERAPVTAGALAFGQLVGDDPELGALWQSVSQSDDVPGAAFDAALPDLVPVIVDEALILADGSGTVDGAGQGSSLRFRGTSREELVDFLDRMVRVHRLRHAIADTEAAGAVGFSFPTAGLSIAIERRVGEPDGAYCDEDTGETEADIDAAATRFAHCDQLWLTLSNSSDTPRDVTVLYVDRDGGITALWPGAESNRISFGESAEIGLQLQNPEAVHSVEELIVLAVPADPDGPRTVLTALADPSASRGRGTPARDYLLAAAGPEDGSDRNFSFNVGPPPLEATRFPIHLRPNE